MPDGLPKEDLLVVLAGKYNDRGFKLDVNIPFESSVRCVEKSPVLSRTLVHALRRPYLTSESQRCQSRYARQQIRVGGKHLVTPHFTARTSTTAPRPPLVMTR